MSQEDYNRIATEFGEKPPEAKPETKEKPKVEVKNLKKPVHKEPPTTVKITNGFVFGFKSALGFWIVSLVIALILYFLWVYGYLKFI